MAVPVLHQCLRCGVTSVGESREIYSLFPLARVCVGATRHSKQQSNNDKKYVDGKCEHLLFSLHWCRGGCAGTLGQHTTYPAGRDGMLPENAAASNSGSVLVYKGCMPGPQSHVPLKTDRMRR